MTIAGTRVSSAGSFLAGINNKCNNLLDCVGMSMRTLYPGASATKTMAASFFTGKRVQSPDNQQFHYNVAEAILDAIDFGVTNGFSFVTAQNGTTQIDLTWLESNFGNYFYDYAISKMQDAAQWDALNDALDAMRYVHGSTDVAFYTPSTDTWYEHVEEYLNAGPYSELDTTAEREAAWELEWDGLRAATPISSSGYAILFRTLGYYVGIASNLTANVGGGMNTEIVFAPDTSLLPSFKGSLSRIQFDITCANRFVYGHYTTLGRVEEGVRTGLIDENEEIEISFSSWHGTLDDIVGVDTDLSNGSIYKDTTQPIGDLGEQWTAEIVNTPPETCPCAADPYWSNGVEDFGEYEFLYTITGSKYWFEIL